MAHPGGAADGDTSLRDAAEAAMSGVPLETHATKGSPLAVAMQANAKPQITV